MHELQEQKESTRAASRAQAGKCDATTLVHSCITPAHHQPLACAPELPPLKTLPRWIYMPLLSFTPLLRTAGGDLQSWYKGDRHVVEAAAWETNCL